jgi:hypothetical protein
LESSIKERHHDESVENIEGKRFRNRPPAITTMSPLGCSQITHAIVVVHLFVVLTRCPHSLSSLGNNPNASHTCEIIPGTPMESPMPIRSPVGGSRHPSVPQAPDQSPMNTSLGSIRSRSFFTMTITVMQMRKCVCRCENVYLLTLSGSLP